MNEFFIGDYLRKKGQVTKELLIKELSISETEFEAYLKSDYYETKSKTNGDLKEYYIVDKEEIEGFSFQELEDKYNAFDPTLSKRVYEYIFFSNKMVSFGELNDYFLEDGFSYNATRMRLFKALNDLLSIELINRIGSAKNGGYVTTKKRIIEIKPNPSVISVSGTCGIDVVDSSEFENERKYKFENKVTRLLEKIFLFSFLVIVLPLIVWFIIAYFKLKRNYLFFNKSFDVLNIVISIIIFLLLIILLIIYIYSISKTSSKSKASKESTGNNLRNRTEEMLLYDLKLKAKGFERTNIAREVVTILLTISLNVPLVFNTADISISFLLLLIGIVLLLLSIFSSIKRLIFAINLYHPLLNNNFQWEIAKFIRNEYKKENCTYNGEPIKEIAQKLESYSNDEYKKMYKKELSKLTEYLYISFI